MSANLEYNGFGLFSSTVPRFYNIFTISYTKKAGINPVFLRINTYAFICAGCEGEICLSRSMNSSPVIVSRSSR